ncbi:MAG: hypothetical protein K9K67_08695 [Bacteriovoracaceae bacterium]|nr:hypothetical protein [Bacteriovoracaceae bacterium]
MKLFSRRALYFFITVFLFDPLVFARLAVISGQPNSWQEKVAKEFLMENALDNEELVLWDKQNTTCHRRTGFILQLCFKGDELLVIHQEQELIGRTLGQLIKINAKTEKALQRRAQ